MRIEGINMQVLHIARITGPQEKTSATFARHAVQPLEPAGTTPPEADAFAGLLRGFCRMTNPLAALQQSAHRFCAFACARCVS